MGVWVLDVDEPNALAALADKHGPLPTTRQSRSSRGLHLWFRYPGWPIPLLTVPSSTGRVAPGIDVKSEGGYVIAPPSVHPDGVNYGWLNDEPIAEAPGWLLALARKPPPPEPPPPRPSAPVAPSGAYGAAALRAEITILAATPAGRRNHQLNRAAFSLYQLVAAGELVGADVERRLIEAAGANGLVDDDGIRTVMATIASGRRAGLAHPRSRPTGRAA